MPSRWQAVYVIPLSVGVFALLLKLPWLALLRREADTETQFIDSCYTTLVNLVGAIAGVFIGKVLDRQGSKLPLVFCVLASMVVPVMFYFHRTLPIQFLFVAGFISQGIYGVVLLPLQSYIMSQTNGNMKYLGILYACFAFSFLMGAGLLILWENKFANLKGIGQELLEGRVTEATYLGKLDRYTQPACFFLVGYGLLMLLVVSILPYKSTNGENTKTRVSFRETVAYLWHASPNVKTLAVLNMLRVAAFTPVVSNLVGYMERRFPNEKPTFYAFIAMNAITVCILLPNSKRFIKRYGRKTVLLAGMFSFGAINVCYAMVQESFYEALAVPSIFYGVAFLANPILDTLIVQQVAEEEQGTVLGAVSQARSLASFVLTIPAGKLFTEAETQNSLSGDPSSTTWWMGLPFLLFAPFGFYGMYVANRASFINDDPTTPTGDMGHSSDYTKLDDVDSDGIEEVETNLEAIGRSDSFVELTGKTF